MDAFFQRARCCSNSHQSLLTLPAPLCLPPARFTVLYLVHALYWREGLSYLGRINGNRGWARRLLGEVLQGLFILWGFVVLSIAWCIGVTRFRDNRHNIDDILVRPNTADHATHPTPA